MEAKSVGESRNLLQTLAAWPVAVKNYFDDLRMEMRRVTWPSWKQVRATTGVVIASVFAFAAYFAVVDSIFGRSITRLFNALSR